MFVSLLTWLTLCVYVCFLACMFDLVRVCVRLHARVFLSCLYAYCLDLCLFYLLCVCLRDFMLRWEGRLRIHTRSCSKHLPVRLFAWLHVEHEWDDIWYNSAPTTHPLLLKAPSCTFVCLTSSWDEWDEWASWQSVRINICYLDWYWFDFLVLTYICVCLI